MKTFNDLKPLKIYSSSNKLYIPIDKENKKKKSCMVILGNTNKSVDNVINSNVILNNNMYRSYYTEKGINKLLSVEESALLEDSKINSFNSAKELSNWMKNNIKYSNYTKLKSHDEVLDSKTGSCHDQVVFELSELKKIGYKCGAFFIIEYNKEGKGTDAETHSFVWYEDNGNYYWFENAWSSKQGIHKFTSKDNIKKEFIKMHNNGIWGNNEKYPELEISNFKYTHGQDLQSLVNTCLEESSIISESIIHTKPKIKFRYMNGTTTMMKEISKYINEESVRDIYRKLNNNVLIDGATFNIYVHDKLPIEERSYIYDIHVASPLGFDEDTEGKYEYYLKHELALSMITSINPNVNQNLAIYIAMVISDQYKSLKGIKNVSMNGAHVIDSIYRSNGPKKIVEIIRNNDIAYVAKYDASHFSFLKDLFSESAFYFNDSIIYEYKLSTKERNKLDDSEFGIPSERKYPLNDCEHTKSAIKFFNYVDKEHEEELAKNIIKKMKKYKIDDVEIGENNRLKKYI